MPDIWQRQRESRKFLRFRISGYGKSSFMKIPNAERAIVDIRKLRDYCLNFEHDDGKHKAYLFFDALGITDNDAEELCDALLEAIKTHDAQLGKRDTYGQRYTVDFVYAWKSKQATIRSEWIIEQGSDIPRLITAYPL
jgi:hypothetical protein